MKLFKKFTSRNQKIDKPDDISEISRAIRPLVHGTSMDVASTYMMHLLAEPVDYIIHAVWGIKENGHLDDIQMQIHKKTEGVVNEVHELFGMGEMSDEQVFAICSLVRELMISKIAHSVEIAKGIMNRPKDSCIQEDPTHLGNMKVLGTA